MNIHELISNNFWKIMFLGLFLLHGIYTLLWKFIVKILKLLFEKIRDILIKDKLKEQKIKNNEIRDILIKDKLKEQKIKNNDLPQMNYLNNIPKINTLIKEEYN